MNTWQHLTIEAFKSLRAGSPGSTDVVQVVDIRDRESYQAGHIPGARLLNDETIEEFMSSADKTRPLVVCCYHGHSSQNAAEFLAQQKFTEVYSLDGGYTAWAGQE